MKQFTVPPKYDQKRIDTFLFEMLQDVNASVIFKAFRKRSVRVNEGRVKESFILSAGDKVEAYIPDPYLDNGTNGQITKKQPAIVYEDDYILVVSKPQGMPVRQDRNNEEAVLDQWVQDFLRNRDGRIYDNGYPALCHRIDRNTGGLVLFARDPETLDIMEDKFRNHEIKKTYLCLVNGVPEKSLQELTGYLRKDSKKNRVFIYDNPVRGSERIVTRCRTIKKFRNRFALLEVELVTGKTHQIRAHLAYIGHPIVGDGKYGINEINKSLHLKWQALWAVRMAFDFNSPAGHLEYLKGKTVELHDIPWESGISALGQGNGQTV